MPGAVRHGSGGVHEVGHLVDVREAEIAVDQSHTSTYAIDWIPNANPPGQPNRCETLIEMKHLSVRARRVAEWRIRSYLMVSVQRATCAGIRAEQLECRLDSRSRTLCCRATANAQRTENACGGGQEVTSLHWSCSLSAGFCWSSTLMFTRNDIRSVLQIIPATATGRCSLRNRFTAPPYPFLTKKEVSSA
jgi:hypothetical protein